MTKYRKRPTIVEAEQYLDDTIFDFVKDDAIVDYIGRLIIETLEGPMICNKGDFVIKGVHGEFYPCRKEIFYETYDELEEQ